MKTIILMLALAGVACGRLGETLEQCKKRYGEPILVKKNSDTSNYTYVDFSKSGFTVQIVLTDIPKPSRTNSITYTHKDPELMTGGVILALLDKNSEEGETWRRPMSKATVNPQYFWKSSLERVARVTPDNTGSGEGWSLSIVNSDMHDSYSRKHIDSTKITAGF